MLNKDGVGFDCVLAISVVVATVAFAAGFWFFFKKPQPPDFLDRSRKQIQLIEKIQVSHDTWRFVFSLDSRYQALGLPVGYHIKLFAPNTKGNVSGLWNGKTDEEAELEEISRKYTPISPVDLRGSVVLLIKIYKKQQQPPFTDGGKMTQYLDSLKIGDKVHVQGPFGKIRYLGCGRFSFLGRLEEKKKIGLIGGGTGITPLYQLLQYIYIERNKNIQVYLIYANKTEDDILLRKELESLEIAFEGRLRVWFVLEYPPSVWIYSKGIINKEIIKNNLPPPSLDSIILCCGPPPMIQFACLDNLKQLGYPTQDVLVF